VVFPVKGTTVVVVVVFQEPDTMVLAAAMVILIHHPEDTDHHPPDPTANLTALPLQGTVKAILLRSSSMATDSLLNIMVMVNPLSIKATVNLLSIKATANLHNIRDTSSHTDHTRHQALLPLPTSIHTAISNRTITHTTVITPPMRLRRAHSNSATERHRTTPSSTVTVPENARPC
jgi:hypothetical protein